MGHEQADVVGLHCEAEQSSLVYYSERGRLLLLFRRQAVRPIVLASSAEHEGVRVVEGVRGAGLYDVDGRPRLPVAGMDHEGDDGKVHPQR